MPLRLRKIYRVLQTHISPKNLDLACAILFCLGISIFEEKRHRRFLQITAQLPKEVSSLGLIKNLIHTEQNLAGIKIFYKTKIKKIPTGSWANRYQTFLKPFFLISSGNINKQPKIRIDPRGIIPKKLQKDTLYIDSNLAFGTGIHATTQLSAELLGEALLKFKSATVLDMGCGTSILAMLAKKLGAKSVVAVDNDPEALIVAKQNLKNNKIKGVVLKNNLNGLQKKFSVIVSNIGLNTLKELHPLFKSHLAKNGVLVLSGLLYKDCKEMIKTYRSFQLIKRGNKRGWSALLLKRNTNRS